MKGIIPAAVVLAIIVVFMILTQRAPKTEQYVIPVDIEQPAAFLNDTIAKPAEEDIKAAGIRMSAELDAAIAEYYQIIFSLKHEQDPVLQEKLAKYHEQWLDENAMKFYSYRHFLETNFNKIEALGLNPAELLENVNKDIRVMEQNRMTLRWNGTNSTTE